MDSQNTWRAILTLILVVPWVTTVALAIMNQADWEHLQRMRDGMRFRFRPTGRWTNN